MNVLFMTLLDFNSIDERNIYTDLLRKIHEKGQNVYIVSPMEKRKGIRTKYFHEGENIFILKPRIGNIQKTNVIEKGISTITLEQIFITSIKKYFSCVKFDIIIYATPPITLQRVVAYIKKRDGAAAYLLLKDIFPQNAVDMGMLSTSGIRSILYRYFRKKEKRLYRNSDFIGCMSKANMEYILNHNKDIIPEKVEICPNCIEPTYRKQPLSEEEKTVIKNKFGIPQNAMVFVYGGNLGKPQGIDFIIECLKASAQIENIFILIVGTGTEYGKLESAIKINRFVNVKLFKAIPKKEYDLLLHVCHVGLLFLDFRFTIPNFPSRLLSYMDAQLPVLAIVDENTDVGETVRKGGFGWECRSNNASEVAGTLKHIRDSLDLEEKGRAGKAYLEEYYNVQVVYDIIMSHFVC